MTRFFICAGMLVELAGLFGSARFWKTQEMWPWMALVFCGGGISVLAQHLEFQVRPKHGGIDIEGETAVRLVAIPICLLVISGLALAVSVPNSFLVGLAAANFITSIIVGWLSSGPQQLVQTTK